MAKKYVIDGAKIKCLLCTKPEGKLMVTSNQIKLQGKLWATEADKGKPNLMFQGNCTKFSNNQPPCTGVISPIQWQDTAMGITIDGNTALLESSTIMCETGGVPITIEDPAQKDTPTDIPLLIPLEDILLVSNIEGPFTEFDIEARKKFPEKGEFMENESTTDWVGKDVNLPYNWWKDETYIK